MTCDKAYRLQSIVSFEFDFLFYCTDIGLECLATWKDGSEMFFYGRLSGAGIVDKEDKYRCFVSLPLTNKLLRPVFVIFIILHSIKSTKSKIEGFFFRPFFFVFSFIFTFFSLYGLNGCFVLSFVFLFVNIISFDIMLF